MAVSKTASVCGPPVVSFVPDALYPTLRYFMHRHGARRNYLSRHGVVTYASLLVAICVIFRTVGTAGPAPRSAPMIITPRSTAATSHRTRLPLSRTLLT